MSTRAGEQCPYTACLLALPYLTNTGNSHEEPTSGRALASKTAQDGMTVELCASIAAGKAYFGLEYGRECWYFFLLCSRSSVPLAARH